MTAEILTIGDELLIGQITNTNSVWMAQQLNLIGIKVAHMASIADDENAILRAMADAENRHIDFVFITGGLGPTKDDVTKKTFAGYFNTHLEIDPQVLSDVEDFFAKRGRTLTEINRAQALVPKGALVFRNSCGTAPGMWMKKNNTVFISMPGVPHEMKTMMQESVLPKIKSENKLPHIYHRSVITQGIGESMLAEKISEWESALAEKNIQLAYLPQAGIVRLRLSSQGDDWTTLKKNVDEEIEKLNGIIEEYIYAYENYGEEMPTLEKVVSELLRERKQTLALAESCTGGYIAHLFTSIAGASDIIKGGIVSYTNEAKHNFLDVDNKLFETVGAVSKECVEQMASNARKKFKSDFAIAVSGIAGPTGGTPEKPVGTVWIAVADKEKTLALKFLFGDTRQRNIVMAANAAINLLRKFILKKTE